MTALTDDERALRRALIDDAAKRHPGDYTSAIREGVARFRVAQRRGLREAVATSTNPLNDSNPADNQDDAGGNSFEAFLASMIALVAQKAAADGKTNPAYTQLAAKLAVAQATSSGGVRRGSFVSPAAGTTPTGRTGESARQGAFLAEALTLAAMHLPPQQGTTAQPTAVPVKIKPLEDMSAQELAREAAVRFAVLHRAGALRSPIYKPVAA